jgi:hypothetical protein
VASRSSLSAMTQPVDASPAAPSLGGVLADRMAAVAGSLRARASALARSPAPRELLVWHLFLLVPTLAFKGSYLRTIWRAETLWGADGLLLGLDSNPATAVLAGARLVASDVLQLAALVLAVWLVGRVGLGIRTTRLALSTLALAVLIGGASWLCLSQSGSFPTVELLALAAYWVRDNPGLVLEFHPVRVSALLIVATGWALVLGWLLRQSRYGRVGRLTPLALASATAVAAAAGAAALPSTLSHDAEVARRGFWVTALGTFWESMHPETDAVPPPPRKPELAAAARQLAYPTGRPRSDGVGTTRLAPARPRHVLMLIFETAPQKYYSLADNPGLPTFAAMRRHSIVSEKHYTTRPFSTDANYSALSGVYPPSLKLGTHPPVSTDGLASVLSAQGYDATYIDAYRLDWTRGDRRRRLWSALGFAELVELEPAGSNDRSYDARVSREAEAFRTALERIETAERRDRKALVVIASALGHFEWKSRPEHRKLPPARKLFEIARVMDRLTGQLLAELARRRIADVAIVITGDHGLRYGAEFTSLGEDPREADPRFNVPFLLYAPGLVDREIRLPYPTSHVDITPTLLALLGVSTEGRLYHGENMLDPALADRALFLLNARLAPFDYLLWKGGAYEIDHVTGLVSADPARQRSDTLEAAQVRELFDAATQVFDLTASRFARDRRTPRPSPLSVR